VQLFVFVFYGQHLSVIIQHTVWYINCMVNFLFNAAYCPLRACCPFGRISPSVYSCHVDISLSQLPDSSWCYHSSFLIIHDLPPSDSTTLSTPVTCHSTLSSQLFLTAAATVWNTLSARLQNATSLSLFRHELKTLLFNESFPA